MSKKLWTNKVTPTMLADALESGDWVRHKGQMSRTVDSKHNCCLGVVCRLAGQDPKWNEAFWDRTKISDMFEYAEFAPWLTDTLQENFAILNDSDVVRIWTNFIIPILREIKVTKKNQLAAKQTSLVSYLTTHFMLHPKTTGGLRQWFLDIEKGELP